MKKKTKLKNLTDNKIFSNNINMEQMIEINLQSSNETFTTSYFVETIDANKLSALLKSKDILQTYTEPMDLIHYENERKHLTKILHSLTKENTSIITYAGGSGKDYGRVYSNKSLSVGSLRKEIRHFLCKELYWDIDMENCHPNLLVGICKLYSISCPCLKQYIKKREEILANICEDFHITRCDAKAGICALINGGGIKTAFDTCDDVEGWLPDFKDECQRIVRELKEKEKDLYQKITKSTASSKKLRTFISYYLQMIEVEVMKEVFEFACDKGMVAEHFDTNMVLCHDGIMMEKKTFTDSYNVEKFIEELNEKMKNLYPDYNCKFAIKSMGRHYQEICIKLKQQKIDYDEIYIDDWTEKYGISRAELPELEGDDTNLSNLYYNQNDDRWVHTMGTLYRKNKVGIYKKSHAKGLMVVYRNYMKEMVDFKAEPEDVGTHFLNKAESLLREKSLLKDKDTKKKWNELKKYINRGAKAASKCNDEVKKKLLSNKSLKDIVNLMMSSFNDDKFDELLDANDNLMGFENGILEIPNEYKKDWYKVRPAKKGEYVNMTCGYDFYIDEKVLSAKKDIEKIILAMFVNQAVMTYILKTIAKTIRGHNNREEEAYFWRGEGSNGKGLLLEFIKLALGNYFFTLSYKILAFVSKDSDNRLVALFDARKKRFLSITEPDKTFQWQSDQFKLFTGGDEINCRNNYAKETIQFIMNCLFIQANHFINMLGNTRQNCIRRRIAAIDFPFLFKPTPKGDEKQQDNTIKDKLKSNDDYKRAFMLILLEHYDLYLKEGLKKPEEVKRYSKEYSKNLSADAEWFDDNLKKGNKNIKLSFVLNKFNKDNHKNWGLKHFKEKLDEFNYKIGKGIADIWNYSDYWKGNEMHNKGWHKSKSHNDIMVQNVFPAWIELEEEEKLDDPKSPPNNKDKLSSNLLSVMMKKT